MKCAAIAALLAASGKAMPDPSFSYDPSAVTNSSAVPPTGYYDANGQWVDPTAQTWDPTTGAWIVDGDSSDDDTVVAVSADPSTTPDPCVDQYVADMWSCIDWSNVVGEVCVPTTTTTTITVDDWSCTTTETVQNTVTETCPTAATVTDTTTVEVACSTGGVVTETCPEATTTECTYVTETPTITDNKYNYVLTIIHPQVSITETVSQCAATTEYVDVTEYYTATNTVYDTATVCVPSTTVVYTGTTTETATSTCYDAPVTTEYWHDIYVPVGCVLQADTCDGVSPNGNNGNGNGCDPTTGYCDPAACDPTTGYCDPAPVPCDPSTGAWCDPNGTTSPNGTDPYGYGNGSTSPGTSQPTY